MPQKMILSSGEEIKLKSLSREPLYPIMPVPAPWGHPKTNER